MELGRNGRMPGGTVTQNHSHQLGGSRICSLEYASIRNTTDMLHNYTAREGKNVGLYFSVDKGIRETVRTRLSTSRRLQPVTTSD